MQKKSELISARLYYFAYMGAWGFILPFLNLFYVHLGLNGKQIGAISSTSAIVGVIAAPFIVSRIKIHPQARTFLQIIIIIAAFGYFMIGQQTTFTPIIFIIIMQALAVSSVMPLSDSMVVAVAQAFNTGYGSVRVFGSLGWILIVPVSGWLIEHFGFKAGFAGVSLGWIFASMLLLQIPKQYFPAPASQDAPRPGLFSTIRRVQKNRTLVGFAIAVIAIGVLNNGVLQFENVFLSDLGASKQLISYAGILSAIVELPFMLISDRFMRRFGPHRLLMAAIFLTFAQRFTVFLVPSIATIMIVRFIGGMAFSFYTISYIGLISSQTEANETGTVLALFTVTLAGMVNVIASPMSGAIYDLIGARWLYASAATGYAIAAISLWVSRPTQSNIT
jgi:PPP family 3-phenylpropionic acid transporter